MAPISMTLNDL